MHLSLRLITLVAASLVLPVLKAADEAPPVPAAKASAEVAAARQQMVNAMMQIFGCQQIGTQSLTFPPNSDLVVEQEGKPKESIHLGACTEVLVLTFTGPGMGSAPLQPGGPDGITVWISASAPDHMFSIEQKLTYQIPASSKPGSPEPQKHNQLFGRQDLDAATGKPLGSLFVQVVSPEKK